MICYLASSFHKYDDNLKVGFLDLTQLLTLHALPSRHLDEGLKLEMEIILFLCSLFYQETYASSSWESNFSSMPGWEREVAQ